VKVKLHSLFVPILVKVINSVRVEGRRPSNQTVYLIALLDEELSQIGAILTRYTYNQGFFHVSPTSDLRSLFQALIRTIF